MRTSDTLWPMTPLGDAQWPDVSDAELAKLRAPAAPAAASAIAPAAPVTAMPADQAAQSAPQGADSTATGSVARPADVPNSSFLDGILRRLGVGSAASVPAASAPAASEPSKDASDRNDALTTGASLDVPPLRPAPRPAPASFVRRFPPDFAFEGGARYWYSTGNNRFGFTNGNPLFGSPTSTLDWDRMTGHSAEGFARIDHLPSHLFVKGVIGGGILKGGDMDDVDFLVTQTTFSNTTSAVDGNNLRYGIIDFGYAFEVPSEGIRFGGFVGYHYWHERMTAFGVMCNPDGVGNVLCGAPGNVIVPFSTPVDVFDTTWHALRVGVDGKIRLYDRWTIAGEIAFVPYAHLSNEDSHLLRTDLGPVPNVLTHASNAMGAEAEAFINYMVVPHFEVGLGVRYWGLFTNSGAVNFGPDFSPELALTRFNMQRYGVLFQAKASF